jgi:hypothetical protein
MEYWITFSLTLAKLLGSAAIGGCLLAGAFWLWMALDEYRSLRTLSRLHCPSCRGLFGMPAARAAKERFERECTAESQRIWEQEGGDNVLIDIDFTLQWQVDCPGCATTWDYSFVDGRLVFAKPLSHTASDYVPS